MRIRNLTIDDVERLVAVWEAAGLPYRPRGRDRRDRVEQEMADLRSAFLAAEEDGEVLGVVLATHDGRKGWINRLAVVPAARCRGVGAALVAAAEEWLAARRLLVIACLIETDNAASLALFQNEGYARDAHIAYLAKRVDSQA